MHKISIKVKADISKNTSAADIEAAVLKIEFAINGVYKFSD